MGFRNCYFHGLTLDLNSEEKVVELFSQSIIHGENAFLQNPQMRPVIPSWNRVISADPRIFNKIRDAVEADNLNDDEKRMENREEELIVNN